jgi:hypothetical protein
MYTLYIRPWRNFNILNTYEKYMKAIRRYYLYENANHSQLDFAPFNYR